MAETGEKGMDSDIEENCDRDAANSHWRNYWIRGEWWSHGIFTSEIPSIEIHCNQDNGKYFIGEDVRIMASLGDTSVCRVTWLKENVDHETTEIKTTLQKYTGSTSIFDKENPKLIIKNCDESDIMTYFLAVFCKQGLCIYSNKIDLKVVKGRPEVTIDIVPLALENECVEFKAKIRGFPKWHGVTWMKNNQPIYTTDPKYGGSINDEESPVLCIKNVKVEDSGVYKIIVRNEYGKTERSENLEVIGASRLIFIAGPVVVSPLETITFHAYMPGAISNAVWWKINDKSTEALKDDNRKYCLSQMKDKMRFEITLAEKEDSAAYQLHWKKKKSNKIYVHVDDSGKFSTSKLGNCLRLFELQSVSADAMRVVFNKLAQTLEEKIKLFCAVTRNSKRKCELRSRLKNNTIDQSKDVDISLMYTVIKKMSKENEKPKNGWGNLPQEDHTDTLDDIERIYYYRNRIAHSDAKGMDTNTFNLSSLDLFRAVGRLSKYDPKLSTKLIKASCDIMNRVSTTGKDLQELIEKVKNLQMETEMDQTPLNKDLSSSPKSSSREDMDEGPGPRTSFSTTNKDPPSPPSSPQGDARDDGPMHRASPSSSNKDPPSPPSSPQDDARDDGPMHRASPSSSNKDLFSSPSLFLQEDRDEAPRHRTLPSMTNQDLFSSPSLFLHEDRDEAPRHRTPPSMTNQDLFSSPSLFLHEDRDEAPRHRTSPSMTNQEIYVRAQRTEGPMTYADRKFSDNSESETNDRAQRTERPFIYADRRFSDNAVSENHYRSQITERPRRYANRRLSNNTDSESLYYTRIPTRSGKIEHIRFHEVCDPEIIMDETYTTAKQTKPCGDGMFFMNRPLKLEEKIHIYGCTYSNASFRESRPTIKIGLISIDPGEIREAVQQKKYYVRGLEEIKCFSDDDQKTGFFHMYICLCPNATLSICVNGLQEHFYENQEISSFNAIWLVIKPYGIDKIKILPN